MRFIRFALVIRITLVMLAYSRRLISASIAFLWFYNWRFFGWAISRRDLEWKPPQIPFGLTRCELHVDCPIIDNNNNETLYFYNPGLYPRNVCGTKLEPRRCNALRYRCSIRAVVEKIEQTPRRPWLRTGDCVAIKSRRSGGVSSRR